jgi:hypothetical protein
MHIKFLPSPNKVKVKIKICKKRPIHFLLILRDKDTSIFNKYKKTNMNFSFFYSIFLA